MKRGREGEWPKTKDELRVTDDVGRRSSNIRAVEESNWVWRKKKKMRDPQKTLNQRRRDEFVSCYYCWRYRRYPYISLQSIYVLDGIRWHKFIGEKISLLIRAYINGKNRWYRSYRHQLFRAQLFGTFTTDVGIGPLDAKLFIYLFSFFGACSDGISPLV